MLTELLLYLMLNHKINVTSLERVELAYRVLREHMSQRHPVLRSYGDLNGVCISQAAVNTPGSHHTTCNKFINITCKAKLLRHSCISVIRSTKWLTNIIFL